jgi:heme-degrading monooxygenase HmoA
MSSSVSTGRFRRMRGRSPRILMVGAAESAPLDSPPVHARISTYELALEKLEDGVWSFRAAIERIRGLDGFREAFLLVDRENGQAVTITLWEDAHAMASSRVAASRARSEAARAADGEVKSSGEYEIAIHETR